MTTFNTGNPLGSTDVYDRYDNSENLDNFSNGPLDAYADRFGVMRQSLQGIRNASQYVDLGPYAAGLIFTSLNQVFSYDAGSGAEFYSPGPSIVFPYTTTGIGAAEIATFRSAGDAVLRQDLANTSSLGKGAAQIGRNSQVATSIAVLRTLIKTSVSKNAFVTGYYAQGDGGGGPYYLDVADVTSADNGGTVIVATDGGRWKLVFNSFVTVKQFGAKGDAVTDDTTALTAARNWLAALSVKIKLVFPAGIYVYSVSPNWGIANAQIIADGEVRLRYTGTGNAVILDAGPLAGDLLFCVRMGRFIVEAHGGAGHGVYVRSVHHSNLSFRVDGCGATSAAFQVEFAVVTVFDNPEASVNSAGGWYLGAKPKYGMVLDKRLTNEQVAYCIIDNPVMEGVDIGISHLNSLGNMIRGGTLEGCTNAGAVLSATAVRDVYDHVDFEVNVGYDIYCLGNEIEIRSCDSDSIVAIAGGAFNRITGGNFHNVQVDAATQNTRLESFVYNRTGTGGTLVDNGVATRKTNLQDTSKLYLHDAAPAVVGITVAASPFSYVNTTGNDITVFVVGGTVSQVTTQAPGVAANATGQIAGGFTLRPGWTIGVTYSVAPNMLYTAG